MGKPRGPLASVLEEDTRISQTPRQRAPNEVGLSGGALLPIRCDDFIARGRSLIPSPSLTVQGAWEWLLSNE